MKMRIASLTLLALCLAVVPAVAQTDLYDNGAINGTTNAWTVNFGFVVSDTFTLANASTVTGLTFGAWVEPGDTLQSAEVSISSSEFGGTMFFDQTVNFTQSGCVGNQFGLNVCTETSSFFSVRPLNAGTYWLNLQNAATTEGQPVYWDENSGPSSASENSVGTIPSEAFTLTGTTGTTTQHRHRLLSPAASCCSVLASSAWPAYCAASCSNSTDPSPRSYQKPEPSAPAFCCLVLTVLDAAGLSGLRS